MESSQPRRWSWLYLMIAFSPGVVLLLMGAGFWLFSVNEFKAPPAGVVPIPAGYTLAGEDTGGGSGGTTTRWLFIRPPEGVDLATGIAAIEDSMLTSGWSQSDAPRECCARKGTFGLLRRGDEWAAFESGASIQAQYGSSVDVPSVGDAGAPLVVVVLEYTDWGVGRRRLFS